MTTLRSTSLAALFASSLCSAVMLHAGSSCCAPEPKAPQVVKAPSCCSEIQAEPYSRDSVYHLEGAFLQDGGASFTLGQLRGRPVVVAMFFASCTYACPMLLSDMAQIRAALPEQVRDRVALVLVSFDPKRDTPEALRAFRESRQLDAQWTLLTGKNDEVAELAAVLGVKFTLQADGQYAHSNVLTVLNGEGEVVHQRMGLSGGHERVVEALNDAAPKPVADMGKVATNRTKS
jgi:protein SCO1